MDTKKIEAHSAETKKLVDQYLSDKGDHLRIEAQENASRLAQALERPKDTILKLAYSPTVVMAVKAAHDMDLFKLLSQATSSMTVAELAAAKSADPLLVERVMRLVVAHGYAEQTAPREYMATALTREMTKRVCFSTIESMFMEMHPAIQKIPEYLQAANYQSPNDPMNTVLQYAYNFKGDGFSWLGQRPQALSRFNSFMEGQRADRLHWGDWFPVRDEILTHPDICPHTPLVVDIGAGRGHDLMGFISRFPTATGRLILEDLPAVIEAVRGSADLEAAGIETVAYDFFAEEQPVRGARTYYFKNVLHDWSDEKASIILNNLKPAMKPGFSKLILEEYILPDTQARSLPCMTDFAVMMFCAGLERTCQQWTELLDSVGLRVVKLWLREGDELGVIEAELAGKGS